MGVNTNMSGKLKTFPAIFVYDKDVIDVLSEFGRPPHHFRTIKNVAKKLRKSEDEVLRTVLNYAALFVYSSQSPELLSLNVDL